MTDRQRAAPTNAEWILRIAAAVGLGISGLLLYEYLSANPTLCGQGGGCDVVRESKWAWPLGVPMPVVGVVFFTALLVLSGVQGRRGRAALLGTAVVGGLGSVGFIVLQASVIHAWCKYCVVADAAALIAVGAALVAYRRPGGLPGAQGWLAISAVAAAAAVAPFVVGSLAKRQVHAEHVVQEELPAPVAREQKPGVATIVEYMDFECPVCRKLHLLLEDVLPKYGSKVRVVRKMFPLPMHRYAEQAARAWCCADDVGKGEAMASALMHAESLDVASCEKMAVDVGIDLDQFRECLVDERTAARVRSDVEEARNLGLRAVPTFWVGREKFVGLPDADLLRESIDRALSAANQGS
jgi:protein-disulfide isomerase